MTRGVTSDQIVELRNRAGRRGDNATVDLCFCALAVSHDTTRFRERVVKLLAPGGAYSAGS